MTDDEKWRPRGALLYLKAMVLRICVLLYCGVLIACGGSPASTATSSAAPASSGAESDGTTQAADAELDALDTSDAPAAAEIEPHQGDVIDGGVIARAQLQAVIDAGIPTFLQQVRTEPHKNGDRFVGWRVLSVFGDASFTRGPLRVGDTVLGVNGRTIERPEQFFAVWESLPSATQITFQVLRADQAYEVRYAVGE